MIDSTSMLWIAARLMNVQIINGIQNTTCSRFTLIRSKMWSLSTRKNRETRVLGMSISV